MATSGQLFDERTTLITVVRALSLGRLEPEAGREE